MPSCKMLIAFSIPTVFGLEPPRTILFKTLPLSENNTNSVLVPPPSIPIIIFSLSPLPLSSVSIDMPKISEIIHKFSILGQDCPHSHLDTACGLIPNFSANSYWFSPLLLRYALMFSAIVMISNIPRHSFRFLILL